MTVPKLHLVVIASLAPIQNSYCSRSIASVKKVITSKYFVFYGKTFWIPSPVTFLTISCSCLPFHFNPIYISSACYNLCHRSLADNSSLFPHYSNPTLKSRCFVAMKAPEVGTHVPNFYTDIYLEAFIVGKAFFHPSRTAL